MSQQPSAAVKTLIVRAQAYLCALPLALVVETMRPLPVEPLASVPPFVRGMSIVRGEPTPVIDLAMLLGATRELPWRFVTIRIGEKQVALSVGAVAGVFDLDPHVMDRLPPLLSTEAEIRDRVRGLKTGASDYIGKPYESAYVVGRSLELLRKFSSVTENRGSTTVLVIDDSATFREELKFVLEGMRGIASLRRSAARMG